MRRRLRLQDYVALIIFGPAGIFFALYGVYDTFTVTRVLLANEKTTGRVVEMTEHRGSKGSRTYEPVFEYSHRGRTYRGGSASRENSPPQHRVGDVETLHVDPWKPERVYQQTFSDRWGRPIFLLLFGSAIVGFLYIFAGTKEKNEA